MHNSRNKYGVLFIALFFLIVPVCHCFSQSQPFYHISTSNGLSGDNVTSAVTDNSGLIWIGTTEGLNLFDGYRVSEFKNALFPGLSFTKIICLFCDSHNRIWVSTGNGLILLDANRIPHKIETGTAANPVAIGIIETGANEVIVLSDKGSYSLAPNASPFDKRAWVQMNWAQKETGVMNADKVNDISRLINDRYAVCIEDTLVIIDYAIRANLLKIVIDHLASACRLDDENILVASQYGNLYKLNLKKKAIVKEYHLKDSKNKASFIPNIAKVRELSTGLIAVASYFNGLCLLDINKETYSQYVHDALNEFSISENRVSDIFVQKEGNIFVTTFNSGLNLFNISQYTATNYSTFSNGSGDVFDGYVNAIITDKKKQVWIAAFDKVILWNRSNNTSRFMPYYKYAQNLGLRPLEIKALCMDSSGRVWAGLYEEGIAIIDGATGKYKLIVKHDTGGKASALKSAYVHSLEADGNGKIWASSGLGIFTIDTKTFAIDTLLHHPQLKELAGKRIYKIWFDHAKRIWFASETFGAYCYNPAAGTLINYFTKDGFPNGIYYSFAEDKMNNIYIGTSNGLAVLKADGTVKVYNETNGLKGNLCTGLLADDKGDIWIGCRHNTMVRFSPAAGSFKYYAEASGFSKSVFKINSFYKESGGQMYWGTNRGLLIFDADKLNASVPQFNVSVQKLFTKDSVFQFTAATSLNLQYKQNDIAFYFTAVNFSWSKNILYEYKLDGVDNNWIKGTDVSLVKYNSLAPGKYTFRLKASKDGVVWINSLNEITVIITPPFWQTWWFRVLVVLSVGAIFYILFRLVKKRRQEKERLRMEYEKRIAAVEMSALRAQMNPHFIFNSLNSINTFILKNDQENATEYLQKFSSLVRLILDNSRRDWIQLANELKALELYIELELARFGNTFSYIINVMPDVFTSFVWVPPLIIQPYAENAIRHGLIHRSEPGGKLAITIRKQNGELLIEVYDNGIGREASAKMKSKINKLYRPSYGMQITAERLDIVNHVYHVNAGVQVADLKNDDGSASGTLVSLTIQYKTNAGNNS